LISWSEKQFIFINYSIKINHFFLYKKYSLHVFEFGLDFLNIFLMFKYFILPKLMNLFMSFFNQYDSILYSLIKGFLWVQWHFKRFK
jgi:hypothetical protein